MGQSAKPDVAVNKDYVEYEEMTMEPGRFHRNACQDELMVADTSLGREGLG